MSARKHNDMWEGLADDPRRSDAARILSPVGGGGGYIAQVGLKTPSHAHSTHGNKNNGSW